MPYHSKWQDLPTEAINTDTLGIDRMPILEIVDLLGQEDKRVVSAVHKERVDLLLGLLSTKHYGGDLHGDKQDRGNRENGIEC